jgi:hypothetical protein
LLTVGGSHATQYTLIKGQRIDAHFDDSKGTFDVTLALDDGIKRDSKFSVAESVFFVVVLRLEEERQPMSLDLEVNVIYVSSSHSPWHKESVARARHVNLFSPWIFS